MVRRHYPNAPIKEAIIDVHVEPGPDATVESLAKIGDLVKVTYPHRDALFERQISLGVSEASSTQKTIGYRFTSEDRKQIVQCGLNGFAFSRLAPYETWEDMRIEAERLWNMYVHVVHPPKVIRLAVRCINQLDLPLPFRDFREYIRTVPDVSPDLPQGLSGYFMQLQIPQDDIQGMLILNETMVPPSNPTVVSVVLDIDVFKTNLMLSLDNSDRMIWEELETLHVKRNQVFENCVTDKMRELFN